MNPTTNQEQRREPSAVPARKWIEQTTQFAFVLAMFAATSAARAGGGPIQGVVNGVNIVLATVSAICLAIATIGVGICGYKVIFDGATFRDVSNKLLGCAISGAAGTIAGLFMT